MKKEWNIPVLDELDVSNTMKFHGTIGTPPCWKCGKNHEHDKDCEHGGGGLDS
ncbi:paeninodin family lasso peptide [Halobacillus sp. A5]|uniref:paeninodin family lasso peptide n=1 Tax=Halobacillus sp. A5 TaxID=2880263 RepID=UPI0035324CC0|nr:paeninodin family lasso peptide [Halobacillus sp. A5]